MPTEPAPRVAPGDVVVLLEDGGRRYLVRASDKPAAERIQGIGVLDPARLVGLDYGSRHRHGAKDFWVLRPGFNDFSRGIARKAQIILPKDASRILFECDVRSGKRVLESGIGSGALTTSLAASVRPGGRVTVVELREDFAQWGRANLARCGLDDAVEIVLGDVTRECPPGPFDAAILDVPNPADAVPVVAPALAPGAVLCAYSPLVSQVEALRAALDRVGGFSETRTIELLEREWHVGERGSRPEHEVLGHTGFLTFARGGLRSGSRTPGPAGDAPAP